MPEYTVAFLSLGCAKNLVNTEQMMALVKRAGHKVVMNPNGADVAVLNTCGFIDSAQMEAIDTILELAELKKAGALKKLLVAGCMVQRNGSAVREELPEVDGLIGCGSFEEINSAIEAAMDRGEVPQLFGDINGPLKETERMVSTPPWTAYLRIAEGCDNRCAYCIIPFLRGRYRSREMEAILEEAKWLASRGVKELIVIAQDITRYGIDRYGEYRLAPLLKALCQIDGFHWIRLHYLYPDELTEELIDVIASEDKIVKYLDIPIQHIDDKILKAMNRRGTGGEIKALFHTLRQRIPNLVLRTSIICGLPGESEEAFEALCTFLQESRLERAGVFAFSPQEGTKAAEMPGQVDEETAAKRVEHLVELQSRQMDAYNASLEGKTIEVLVEGVETETGRFYGRSWADSPDIDGLVFFDGSEQTPIGNFVQVFITGSQDGNLTGAMKS